jgi:hypothetical protein
MDHSLKAIQQFFPFQDHLFLNNIEHINDPNPLTNFYHGQYFENDANTWVPQYLSHMGVEVYHELEAKYDILVLCGVNEFLHQYMDAYKNIQNEMDTNDQEQMILFQSQLQENQGRDFTFQVKRQGIPTIGYFDLNQLFQTYDQLIPSTVKGLFKDTNDIIKLREWSLTAGSRYDIIRLLKLHSKTLNPTYSIQDIITTFKAPYFVNTVDFFDYSDRVTPMIYVGCLGPAYSEVTMELAPYYGKFGLTIFFEMRMKR